MMKTLIKLMTLLALLVSTTYCGREDLESTVQSDNTAADALELKVLFENLLGAAQHYQASELMAIQRVRQCTSDLELRQHAQIVVDVFKGLLVDGAGGDIALVGDVVYYTGREGIRAAITMSPIGRWILNNAGYKTTDEVIAENAAKVWNTTSNVASYIKGSPEMASYAHKLYSDEGFRLQQALKIYTVLALSSAPILDLVPSTSCDTIRGLLPRFGGQIGYEVALTVGLGMITAEAAGAGGAAKLGALVAKLVKIAKTNKKLEPFVDALVKGLRRIANVILKARESGAKGLDKLDDLKSLYAAGGKYAAVYNMLDNLPMGKMIREMFVNKLGPKVERVLEFACGTGPLGEATKMRYPNAIIVGIDRSDAMLKQAANRTMGSGKIYEKLIQGDLTDIAGWSAHLGGAAKKFNVLMMNMAAYFFDKQTLIKVLSGGVKHLDDEWRIVISYLTPEGDELGFVTKLKNELKTLQGKGDKEAFDFLSSNIDSLKKGLYKHSDKDIGDIAVALGGTVESVADAPGGYSGFARVAVIVGRR